MQIVAQLGVAEISEGQAFSFDAIFSSKMIDDYAKLTGDISPLHMDVDFARNRGFKGRVVHGTLLSGLVSRLVGVHLPGRNGILNSINMKYLAPVYAEDCISITGTVEQISIAANAMIVQVSIINISSQLEVAKAKVTVGFTQALSK